MPPPPPEPRKIHPLSRRMRALLIFFSAFAAGMFATIMILAWGQLSIAGMIAAAILVLPAGVMLVSLSSRLVTSPSGIDSYEFLSHTYSNWEDCLGLVQTMAFVGLVFHKPETDTGLWAQFSRKMVATRTIQISPYVENWHDSELMREIRRYAPAVLAPYDSAATQLALELRGERKPVPFYASSMCLLGYFLVSILVTLLLETGVNSLVALDSDIQFAKVVSSVSQVAAVGCFGGGFALLLGLQYYSARQTLYVEAGTYGQAVLIQYLKPWIGLLFGLVLGIAVCVYFYVTSGRIGAFSSRLMSTLNMTAMFVPVLIEISYEYSARRHN